MELLKINYKEFGIEESKAKQISSVFKPMLDKMEGLEGEWNQIKTEKMSPELAERAKELRLKYVKVRTATAAIHKEQKAFYLAGGRFIDGWKNAQLFASQGIEAELMNIEKHEENKEKERLAAVREKRIKVLSKFGREDDPIKIELMQDEVWSNYINGVELAFNQAKEAEDKAEQERVKREERERILNERQIEISGFSQWVSVNVNLKSITDKEYRDLIVQLRAKKSEHQEKQKEIKAENDRLKRERKEADEKAESERKKREAQERIEREESERKISEARKEKEEAQAKLKAKEDEEAKRKEDEEKRIQSELGAADSDKVKMLVSDLNSLKIKYKFKSKNNQKMYLEVSELIGKIVNHIEK